MTRRELVPMVLVLTVTVADALHLPTVAFYLLLASIPAIVCAFLGTVEDVLDRDSAARARSIATVQVAALALVLVAAAVRAPMRSTGEVPQVALSAVVACLLLFGVQIVIVALPTLRRTFARAPQPARPAA